MKVFHAIDLLERLCVVNPHIDLSTDLGITIDSELIERYMHNEVARKLMLKNQLPKLPDHAKVIAACGLPTESGDYLVIRRNPHRKMKNNWQIAHVVFDAKLQSWLNPASGLGTEREDCPMLAYWTLE